jgi:hypothetical protein
MGVERVAHHVEAPRGGERLLEERHAGREQPTAADLGVDRVGCGIGRERVNPA